MNAFRSRYINIFFSVALCAREIEQVSFVQSYINKYAVKYNGNEENMNCQATKQRNFIYNTTFYNASSVDSSSLIIKLNQSRSMKCKCFLELTYYEKGKTF